VRVERIVDLSVVLDAGTQVYPGDPRPSFSVATRIATEGYNLLRVEMGSQSGTHVDSPYHFKEDGLRVEDCELTSFIGPGVVIDVRGKKAREPIMLGDVERYDGKLEPGGIVLLNTGWSDSYFGTDDYFEHPFLNSEACEWLLRRRVRTFGIDCINLDETILDEREPDFSCHLQISAVGGIIAENLTNLSSIDFEDPVVSLLPLKFGGDADGAPCRAVALKVVG
jgi:kynurenine formamidase